MRYSKPELGVLYTIFTYMILFAKLGFGMLLLVYKAEWEQRIKKGGREKRQRSGRGERKGLEDKYIAVIC